jgi:predicted small secreted protein
MESAAMFTNGAVRRPGRVALFVVFALALAACNSGAGTGADPGHTLPMQNGMDVRRTGMPNGMEVRRSADPSAPSADAGGDTSEGPGPTGPPAAIVPDVRGMVFEDAVHRLWRFGIGFDLVFARQHAGRLWSVIQEDPPPRTDTPRAGKINLVIAMPHMHGAGVNGTVRCKPEADELDDPYCLGKLFKY